MRKLRIFLVATALAAGSTFVGAAPAQASCDGPTGIDGCKVMQVLCRDGSTTNKVLSRAGSCDGW